MSWAPLFRKQENREIIFYLRKHGTAVANDIPLKGISLRKKSILLKKLYDSDILTKSKFLNKWKYKLSDGYKNKVFYWEDD